MDELWTMVLMREMYIIKLRLAPGGDMEKGRTQTSLGITLLCLTLGLTAAGIWTDIVGYSATLLPIEINTTPAAYNQDAFLLGHIFSGLVLCIFARHIPKILTTLIVAVTITMSMATGVLLISYHQTLLDSGVFSSIGVFAAGGCHVFLVSLFYIFFAKKIKVDHAVICIAASLVFETVFSILLSLYSSATTLATIVMVAPFMISGFYFGAQRLSRKTIVYKKVSSYEKRVLFTLVIIFSVVMVLIRALSNVGIWGTSRTNFIGMMELSIGELLIISIAVFLMAYFVFIFPKNHFSLQARCIIGLALMLAGLQVLALINDFQLVYTFDTVTTAVELFSHLAKWMIAIECIRKTDLPPFLVTGISRPITALLSLFWVHFADEIAINSTFVMIVLYVLLIAVLSMFLSERKRGEGFKQINYSADRVNQMIVFGNKNGLSQREAQIFKLLLEGNKRREIEEICELSEGTVKAHISNLYRKLGVHSKSEMIVLFENEVAEQSTKNDHNLSQSN